MATYYIRDNGSDSNNGTSADTPFLTRARAQEMWVPGDTMVLLPNAYPVLQTDAIVFSDETIQDTADETTVETLISTDEGNALELGSDDKLFAGTPAADYSVYTIRLLQSGTGAPTAQLRQNTTGVTWAWTRGNTGLYTLTPSDSIITAAKLWISPLTGLNDSALRVVLQAVAISSDFIDFECRRLDTGALVDLGMSAYPTYFELRIYP